jgi:PPE family
MQVDPTGLALAAQRIVEALGELMAVDPVHPPLGPDPASVGAATRLSTAGTVLAAIFAEQAMGLALTAEQLVRVGGGFEMVDESNASNIGAVVAAAAAVSNALAATGWAPPSPPLIPDVRPPLIPPPPVPGEALSAAVHSGQPSGGTAFISAWSHLSRAAEEAADQVRAVAANLPAVWDSPVATDQVRAHLAGYTQSLEASGQRAGEVAEQAGQHGEQLGQAQSEIPTPEEFAALRQRIQQVAQANIASGGKYAIPLAQLTEQLNELNAKATAGYGAYHATTDQTTAGKGDPTGGQAAQGAPDKANELVQMLPQLLGALGGAIGPLFQSVGQLPQGLMQAGSQAAQSLTGMMKGGGDPLGGKVGGDHLGGGEPLKTGKVGGGGGGGATVPVGGSGGLSPASTPSTGRNPTPPARPGGALPPPVSPTGQPGGGMPMGMPMGGMPMGGAGGAGGKERPVRPKNLVVPPTPNTEAVTGKVNADRIALSSGASGKDGRDTPPDDDDPPPHTPKPIVRRISTADPRGEDP